MDRILAFDLWGPYAHYKQIYATTTALTYPIPTKTAIYGLLGAMLGLEKQDNRYLRHFSPGSCCIAIQVRAPLVSTRINMNLRPVFGPLKADGNRKPTTMEFVRSPRYRIFVQHQDERLFQDLTALLQSGQSIYTPTLGIANLIANFAWVGDWQAAPATESEAVLIHSVIPRRSLVRLQTDAVFQRQNRIVEISQYALEMDEERNVNDRDDIILDQHGRPISALVHSFHPIEIEDELQRLCFF